VPAFEPIKCRSCGAAVPVGVGRSDFVCPYCGATDSVDPQLRDRLDRYYRLLRELDAAVKQFPDRLRNKIVKTLHTGRIMHIVVLVTAGWMLILSTYIFHDILGRADETGALPNLHFIMGYLLPFNIFVGLMLWYLFLLWRRRYLRLNFQAAPPAEPGGEARCRLCGASLPPTGVIRRCPYCGADSVVHETWFRRYRRRALDGLLRRQERLAAILAGRLRRCDWAYTYTPVVLVGIIFGLVLVTTVVNSLVTLRLISGAAAGETNWTNVRESLPSMILSVAVVSLIAAIVIRKTYLAARCNR